MDDKNSLDIDTYKDLKSYNYKNVQAKNEKKITSNDF